VPTREFGGRCHPTAGDEGQIPGIPAESDEYLLTVGPTGPTVLHDHYLLQKMQHFNRERVPERVVHAKGSGAHGFFEVTEDDTWFTRASFLAQPRKRTPTSSSDRRTKATPRTTASAKRARCTGP